jgi:cell pole-organizing protein PopZ
VRVLGPDYQPAADESVELVITRRDLDALGDGAPTEEVERRTAESDARGEVAFTLETGRPGAYRVEASFTDDAGQPHADAEVFLRVDQREELRDIAARPALLEALSAATGGAHVAAGERVGNLSLRAPRVEEVDRHRVIDLWSAPWVLFALVGLLSTEWILRRRWGRL